MRERLLVLALAAGALALFYVLVFPKPQPALQELALPLSSEARPEGYLAVWRWLSEQRVPEVSLHQRYSRLPRLLAQPAGNLLIVSTPQRVPARSAELDDLQDWVERGNTLLIVAALYDSPLWAFRPDPLSSDRLERLTGLEFSQSTRADSLLKSLTKDRLDLRPRGGHALLDGVERITAVSMLPVRSFGVRNTDDDSMPLELAVRGDSDSDAPALWLERRGEGQIILCAVASPFSNAAVALSDNARLLANIISRSLAPGGTVIFDDAHQGVTDFYDGQAFFADPRLHRTLGTIVLVWLAFVLGSLPLRASRRSWQPLDEAAYVEGSARYLAAVVPRSDAAQRLIEEFLQSLRERLSLEHDTSIWQWLDVQAGVTPAQRHELQERYASACAGERVDLVRLQNLLAQVRRNLE